MDRARWVRVIALSVILTTTVAEANRYHAVPGQFVVKLKSSLTYTQKLQLERQIGAKVLEVLSPESNSILVVRPLGEESDFAIQSLEANPMVEYAEPNYLYRSYENEQITPNDMEFERQWALANRGQVVDGDMGSITGRIGLDIKVREAWSLQVAKASVLVAGIDSGIDYTHPDLSPNMWVNKIEKAGLPGQDDDGNGVIDDIYGFNAITNLGASGDKNGHGSHTAGVIGASSNNGIGISGINWNTSLMSIQFLDEDGSGTLADAVKAIDYSTRMNADFTNNSWGGGSYSQALYDAIARAREKGILFIAAAGNSGSNNDNTPEFPASYDLDNIISVAAINPQGALAAFSCFGEKSVHIAAPGVNILSTVPGGYESFSGTSMAAPHVTGVAALIKAQEPKIKYLDLKKRMMDSAIPLASLRGKVASGGYVSAYHALIMRKPEDDPLDPVNWPKKELSIETPHPYPDFWKEQWQVEVPGAREISIHFKRFETELGYDKLVFRDKDGNELARMSGFEGSVYSPIFQTNQISLEFESDDIANHFGFHIDSIAYR